MTAMRFGPLSLLCVTLLSGATCKSSTPGTDDASEPSSGDADTLPKLDPATMILEAQGVDLSKLSDAERDIFFNLLNTEPSACGAAHSLAKSIRDVADCKDSKIIAQLMADSIEQGISTGDLRKGIGEVIDSLQPKEIDITGRPVYGDPSAAVTLVVFADFMCPHCAAEAPVLREAVKKFRGQAKIVYRHFPLDMHPHARVASMATEAALAQSNDKFWDMHDYVFANQSDVFDDDDEVEEKLRKGAEKIGLDMVAYDAYMKAGTGKALVQKDRDAGEALKITGTPAVFVNGRYYNPLLFGGTVDGWIDDALRR